MSTMNINFGHRRSSWSSRLGGLVGSARSEGGRSGIESPVGTSQRLKNWHLPFSWLAFSI